MIKEMQPKMMNKVVVNGYSIRVILEWDLIALPFWLEFYIDLQRLKKIGFGLWLKKSHRLICW